MLEAGARVTGIDRDPQAVAASRERLAAFETAGRFRAITANYADLGDVAALAHARFNGVLLDLGVSSHQLDDLARGFSFREGATLDMRMEGGTGEHDGGPDAASLLQEADERTLTHIFRDYADEPRAHRLAREIVRRRATATVHHERRSRGRHSRRTRRAAATSPSVFARLFQAVRIAVNDELSAFERALPALRDRLTPGGVMAVIAYHSGEDRIVKQCVSRRGVGVHVSAAPAVCTCGGQALGTTLTAKRSPRARQKCTPTPARASAHLRAWQSAA